MSESTLLLWAARQTEPVGLRLVCAESADRPQALPGEQVVAWPGCLDSLPAALPFELLGLGIATVVLDAVGCAADWSTDWDQLAATAQVTDRLRVATEPDAGAQPANRVLDAAAMPVLRRRSLLGLGAGPRPAPLLPDQDRSPQQRLRAAVRALAGDDPVVPPEPAGGWAWGALELTSAGCVGCRVCVRSCPEDALVVESHGHRAGLGYDPGLCTGCGRCLKVCDARALASPGRLGPAALLACPVLLEVFEVRRCARCAVEFGGVQEYCPVCEFRVANPFGSRLPAWQRPVTEQ